MSSHHTPFEPSRELIRTRYAQNSNPKQYNRALEYDPTSPRNIMNIASFYSPNIFGHNVSGAGSVRYDRPLGHNNAYSNDHKVEISQQKSKSQRQLSSNKSLSFQNKENQELRNFKINSPGSDQRFSFERALLEFKNQPDYKNQNQVHQIGGVRSPTHHLSKPTFSSPPSTTTKPSYNFNEMSRNAKVRRLVDEAREQEYKEWKLRQHRQNAAELQYQIELKKKQKELEQQKETQARLKEEQKLRRDLEELSQKFQKEGHKDYLRPKVPSPKKKQEDRVEIEDDDSETASQSSVQSRPKSLKSPYEPIRKSTFAKMRQPSPIKRTHVKTSSVNGLELQQTPSFKQDLNLISPESDHVITKSWSDLPIIHTLDLNQQLNILQFEEIFKEPTRVFKNSIVGKTSLFHEIPILDDPPRYNSSSLLADVTSKNPTYNLSFIASPKSTNLGLDLPYSQRLVEPSSMNDILSPKSDDRHKVNSRSLSTLSRDDSVRYRAPSKQTNLSSNRNLSTNISNQENTFSRAGLSILTPSSLILDSGY